MNPKEKVEIIGRMASALEQLEGESVEIIESISHDESRGYDRHCTVVNSFSLLVRRVGWQMSGGHFYLHGEKNQYGINSGHVVTFVAESHVITIVEKYETKTVRKTEIRASA